MDFKIQLPADFSPEERAERARNNFLNGYNCCQSVLLAFSDLLESQVSAELLSVIGSGFGGGMARLREVCGSFSGAVAMAGFISPPTTLRSRRPAPLTTPSCRKWPPNSRNSTAAA